MSQKATNPSSTALQSIADALNRLPDDTEQRRLIDNIEVVERYFSALKDRIARLPSTEERSRILGAVEEIRHFLEKAERNPILGAAIGVSVGRSQARSPKPGQFPLRSVDEFLAELTNLEPAKIQERLADYKRVSMPELRALAGKLGLGAEDRVSRNDLVDQIVKIGFANQRGYDSLRRSQP